MHRREVKTFTVTDHGSFIKKALRWGAKHTYCSYLTPNELPYLHGPFPHLLAVGALSFLEVPKNDNAFSALATYHQEKKDWLFGYLSYDLKNEIEALNSNNPDSMGFAPICFFQPEHILFFAPDSVEIHSFQVPATVYDIIMAQDISQEETSTIVPTTAKVAKEAYIEQVNKIKEDIVDGEVYELNYCMEFVGAAPRFNPLTSFLKLNRLSPMPFASFQRYEDKYVLCASPERFLKKDGAQLISQPIKGTAGRGVSLAEDEQRKTDLFNSEKERAENMMIVDLVRNDLAKSALPGTVQVEELFGIYSYEKVHQMVSTVTARARSEVAFIDIIKNAFPMGSMTGAPKVRAMELIETYETSRRGLYSGASGYITPKGDFDFNVVIRTLLYNQTSGNLSFQVGSAITYDAIAEQEYEECLIKAKAILEILEASLSH